MPSYDADLVIMVSNHQKTNRETAVFLNWSVNSKLEYEEEKGVMPDEAENRNRSTGF